MAVTDHVIANRDRYRKVEIVGLAIVTLLLLAVFGWGLFRASTASVSKCPQLTGNSMEVGLILAGVTIVGFVVGRPVAYFRMVIHQAPSIVEQPVAIRTGGLLQGWLALFLIGATLLLAYETYATLLNGNPPQITSYVRCAAADHAFLPAQLAGWPAAITAFMVGALFGNWLWYPGDDWLWRRKKV